SSTFGTSKGTAPSLWAVSSTWSAGTNRNSASESTNFLMSQGQATRSTFTRSLVTHFMGFLHSSMILLGLCRLRLCVKSGPHPLRQFLSRPLAPEVGEIERRLLADHVVMQGDNMDVCLAQRSQHRLDLLGGHDEVAVHGGVLVRTRERCPGGQAH